MKKQLFLFGFAVFLGVAAFVTAETDGSVPPTEATPENLREVRKDTREDIREMKKDMREDVRETKKDAREDVREEKKETKKEVREVRKDVREERRDGRKELREDIRTEKKDLRALKDDPEEFKERMEEMREAAKIKREEFKAEVEARREEMKQTIEKKREELKKHLETIKDERKKQIVERIDQSIDALNARMAEHFVAVLNKLDELLDRIASRKDKAQANGVDVSAVVVAIADAEAAIGAARDAVTLQSAKTYTVFIGAEEKLKGDVGKTRQALRSDLGLVHDLVKKAHEAIRRAATLLSGVRGIDELEVDAAPTPAPTTAPTAE